MLPFTGSLINLRGSCALNSHFSRKLRLAHDHWGHISPLSFPHASNSGLFWDFFVCLFVYYLMTYVLHTPALSKKIQKTIDKLTEICHFCSLFIGFIFMYLLDLLKSKKCACFQRCRRG